MENKVKIITAKVLKTAMDKSAVVSVERLVKHPVNGKFIKRSTKYHVHDENNQFIKHDLLIKADDDVIVQGGPLYKDVIRAAAGKGDINLTEVPPGGGIGTQRSDLVKLIKGEDIAKSKDVTQKLTDDDYVNQLEDMDVDYVDVLPSGYRIERQFRFDAILNDKDEVLTQAIPAFTLKSILKLGENLKGADKKRAISDRIDQIKPVVKDNLDLQKERYLYFINKSNDLLNLYLNKN